MVRLKNRQKELLRNLVQLTFEGKLKDPIVPFPLGHPDIRFALHLYGTDSFIFKHISDLDILCDAELLSYRWNRHGTGKLYSITKAGYKAVENDFALPSSLLERHIDIIDMMSAMSGHAIQVPGLAEHVVLADVVRDPVLRHTAVTSLADGLRKTAESILPWSSFVVYEKEITRLQEELLRAQPGATRLQTLAATLAFAGEIETDLEVMLKVWVYLYPLLLIGVTHIQRAQQNGRPKR
jgi:hypothetical protein